MMLILAIESTSGGLPTRHPFRYSTRSLKNFLGCQMTTPLHQTRQKSLCSRPSLLLH